MTAVEGPQAPRCLLSQANSPARLRATVLGGQQQGVEGCVRLARGAVLQAGQPQVRTGTRWGLAAKNSGGLRAISETIEAKTHGRGKAQDRVASAGMG